MFQPSVTLPALSDAGKTRSYPSSETVLHPFELRLGPFQILVKLGWSSGRVQEGGQEQSGQVPCLVAFTSVCFNRG